MSPFHIILLCIAAVVVTTMAALIFTPRRKHDADFWDSKDSNRSADFPPKRVAFGKRHVRPVRCHPTLGAGYGLAATKSPNGSSSLDGSPVGGDRDSGG